MGVIKAEYIWVDGTEPTPALRSKTKILPEGAKLPEWGFDGSSTNQAEGHASDCILKPVFTCPDPIRGGKNVLVLAEVYNADGTPNRTNTRAGAAAADAKYKAEEAWWGLEQEYTFFKNGKPYGFEAKGEKDTAPQGPYYCGVGATEAVGRSIVEKHMDACIAAGLKISGINAEVMPGQWEFQIGPATTLEAGDHMLIARWLLHRLAEDEGVDVSFAAKPAKGDWNGAGCHTNFSTKAMRNDGGYDVIVAACEKLGKKADLHIKNYGYDIESRLTGKHETCSYKQFKYGVSDRGASIRIPLQTKIDGKGYLEDRRPNANMDPYTVTRLILETTCG
jgi:glutamine synthetase